MKASLDDPAVVDELCNRIAEGKGIYEVCEADDMPDDATVYRRMARDENFAARIARARAAQQDAEAEKMVLMADEATPENWQVQRLRIWARQWRAAKLAPKKYGATQVNMRHTGAVGTFDATKMSDEQLDAIESAVEAALGGTAAGGRTSSPGEGGEGPEGREPEA